MTRGSVKKLSFKSVEYDALGTTAMYVSTSALIEDCEVAMPYFKTMMV